METGLENLNQKKRSRKVFAAIAVVIFVILATLLFSVEILLSRREIDEKTGVLIQNLLASFDYLMFVATIGLIIWLLWEFRNPGGEKNDKNSL